MSKANSKDKSGSGHGALEGLCSVLDKEINQERRKKKTRTKILRGYVNNDPCEELKKTLVVMSSVELEENGNKVLYR